MMLIVIRRGNPRVNYIFLWIAPQCFELRYPCRPLGLSHIPSPSLALFIGAFIRTKAPMPLAPALTGSFCLSPAPKGWGSRQALRKQRGKQGEGPARDPASLIISVCGCRSLALEAACGFMANLAGTRGITSPQTNPGAAEVWRRWSPTLATWQQHQPLAAPWPLTLGCCPKNQGPG